MGCLNLLVHSAEVYTRTDINTCGRIEQVWSKVGTVPCRFSSPRTTNADPAAGAFLERIDATIFTSPGFLNVTAAVHPPFRFVTTEPGWIGTYEMRTRPRIVCTTSDTIHHCECDCMEVTA